MEDKKIKGFGQKMHSASDDPFTRYSGNYVLIGMPSEFVIGGKVEEFHHDGMFLKPFVLRKASHYEWKREHSQLIFYNAIPMITPVAKEDLEEMVEDINTRLNEQFPKKKRSPILMPDEVNFIIRPEAPYFFQHLKH